MGSILDFPLALFQGSLLGVYESSLAIGSTDLAETFGELAEGVFGSLSDS